MKHANELPFRGSGNGVQKGVPERVVAHQLRQPRDVGVMSRSCEAAGQELRFADRSLGRSGSELTAVVFRS